MADVPRAARTGLDQLVDAVFADTGLAGANMAPELLGGAGAADALNQIILEAAAATGAAADSLFTATEVIAMNTLTANLHLMLVSFYRPSGTRRAILLERSAFPSDRHAVESQVRFHGLDPAWDLIEIAPRDGEDLLRTEDIVATIEREGARIATILLPGVQYLTGQLLDIGAITAAGRKAGCVVGWDLAHAIGNVPVALHDAGADFAVWCTRATQPTRPCRASPAGGATTRPRAS